MHENDWLSVFAPATVGNVGPGFDVLGLALEQPGDTVRARKHGDRDVVLRQVSGGHSLPPQGAQNTAVVAACAVLELLGEPFGVELELHKGMPVGSGLGSSGASAAAAATAVNLLAGSPLSPAALIPACAEAERVACGSAHADNVAAALLGGVVLVRPDGHAVRLRTGLKLALALVTPAQELETRVARQVIPAAIPLGEVVANSAHLAQLVYGLAVSDAELLRGAIVDVIAEPRRAHLIPGFAEVKAAALGAGALGASISGAGPTLFSLCSDLTQAENVLAAMGAALDRAGRSYRGWVSRLADEGARRVRC
ncbi:MAG: homoserine kinase [Deltaproteobacteria bacterium]|nr:homoserine kinase [Deltaproteobacteria bacterium]